MTPPSGRERCHCGSIGGPLASHEALINSGLRPPCNADERAAEVKSILEMWIGNCLDLAKARAENSTFIRGDDCMAELEAILNHRARPTIRK